MAGFTLTVLSYILLIHMHQVSCEVALSFIHSSHRERAIFTQPLSDKYALRTSE